MRTLQSFLYIASLILVASCGHSREENLSSYEFEVSAYNCQSLGVEGRYNEKMIKKLSKLPKNYNPAEDVAITILKLGTNLIPGSASASTKVNLDNRAILFQEKNETVKKNLNKRCKTNA